MRELLTLGSCLLNQCTCCPDSVLFVQHLLVPPIHRLLPCLTEDWHRLVVRTIDVFLGLPQCETLLRCAQKGLFVADLGWSRLVFLVVEEGLVDIACCDAYFID